MPVARGCRRDGLQSDAAVDAAVDTLCDDSDALTVPAAVSVGVEPLPMRVTTPSTAAGAGAVLRTVVAPELV
jgi:hypothetical protein